MHFSMDFRAKSFFRVLISRPGHSSTNLGCQYQRRQGFKLFVFFFFFVLWDVGTDKSICHWSYVVKLDHHHASHIS